MRKVVALSGCARQIGELLTAEEQIGMESSIAEAPAFHPVIPGSGGCRKARWARAGRGKSGGLRTIFYYFVRGETVYLLDADAKSEKENLTDAEKNELKCFAKEISRNS
ncbi:MAG: hypothetical protein EBY17_02980 [Acidobacteriia bacterium]|nr:hypothetical protein [Terriglobia bacterium]